MHVVLIPTAQTPTAHFFVNAKLDMKEMEKIVPVRLYLLDSLRPLRSDLRVRLSPFCLSLFADVSDLLVMSTSISALKQPKTKTSWRFDVRAFVTRVSNILILMAKALSSKQRC